MINPLTDPIRLKIKEIGSDISRLFQDAVSLESIAKDLDAISEDEFIALVKEIQPQCREVHLGHYQRIVSSSGGLFVILRDYATITPQGDGKHGIVNRDSIIESGIAITDKFDEFYKSRGCDRDDRKNHQYPSLFPTDFGGRYLGIVRGSEIDRVLAEFGYSREDYKALFAPPVKG